MKIDKEYLDKINNERVENTKKRVAHAIMIFNALVFNKDKFDLKEACRAMSLLEVGVEEMRWACEHFDWNDTVCDLIDDAIVDVGYGIAFLINNKEDVDYEFNIGCGVKDAKVKLSKVLASLVNWFEEDVCVEDV